MMSSAAGTAPTPTKIQRNYTIAEAVESCGGRMPEVINSAPESTRVYSKSGEDIGLVIYPNKSGAGHKVQSYKLGKSFYCNVPGSASLSEDDAAEAEARWQEIQEAKWESAAIEAKKTQFVLSRMPEAHRLKQDFAYLVRKKLPLQIVVDAGCLFDAEHSMYIFLRDLHGITSYQTIDDNGDKRFLKNGKMAGSFVWVGGSDMMNYAKRHDPECQLPIAILICEGFATAVSLHESTGLPVCAAMSAGNLMAVVKSVRKFYQNAQITICGDDDHFTASGNVGRKKATEAAKAIDAKVCFPIFPEGHRGTDFNDLVSMSVEGSSL
jgi:putative DNA primase/helicase